MQPDGMDSKATTMYHEKTLTLHEITDFFSFFPHREERRQLTHNRAELNIKLKKGDTHESLHTPLKKSKIVI